MIIQLFF